MFGAVLIIAIIAGLLEFAGMNIFMAICVAIFVLVLIVEADNKGCN